MSEFKQVDPLLLDFGGVVGRWPIAKNTPLSPGMVTIEESDLTVEQARALRDWLNKVIP